MALTTSQQEAVLATLRQHVHGTVIGPADAPYDTVRRVWNGAIDQRPLAIVVCADAEDVPISLRLATELDVPVSVRGGGHNVAGRAVRDDALTIDLSRLRAVEVNSNARVVSVQGGALWRDVDLAAAAHGLATTGGLISSTGVGGFTLGGGAGWLMRRHGLAADNLLAAHVVLADGRAVRASEEEHADLFWGLRGGAGGLGVVTRFEFKLHPLGNVLAGLVVYAGADAAGVLAQFTDFARTAPDEFCGLAALINAPPLPFLDPAVHGQPVVALALCWCGDIQAGERALAPLRRAANPLADVIGPMPYPVWQQMQDPSAPPGRLNYWKSVNFAQVERETIRALADAVMHLPTPFTELHLQHLGGAVARVNPADSAYPNRDAAFFLNIIGVAPGAEGFPGMRNWVRALYAKLSPGALATAQPNFMDADDLGATRAFGAERAQRLSDLRAKYASSQRFVGTL